MIKIKAENLTEEEIKKEIKKVKERKTYSKSKYSNIDFEIIEPIDISNYEVQIEDLIKLPYEEFLKESYKRILLRNPDKKSFNKFLKLLISGKLSKRDIIFRIRYSHEGRKKKVKIKGLFPKGFLSIFSFIPFFNYIIKWIKSFIFLNKIDSKLNFLESFLMEKYLNLNHRISLLEKYTNQNKEEIEEISKEIKEFKYKLSNFLEEIEITEYLEEKINFNIAKENDLYFSFENIFRGSETSIKNKMLFYLDKLNYSTFPILDIGCGRCEFLELLKENNLSGIGIDINKFLIKYCKEKGLNVIYADAIEFLINTKNIFSNITMFHIIEHLSLDKQLKLLENAYSKLEKGGKIIIETPNPIYWNSFASFYTDQTHIKPIPSTTLAFYLESIGFKNISIFYLHPDRKRIYKGDKLLRYYQDYSIIGEK